MSNNKQQTAVEWFAEKTFNQIELLKRQIVNQHEFLDNMIKLRDQAKEMEKEQIKDAYWNGSDGIRTKTAILREAEEFYNETYGGKKNEL